jgi:hypothetical protein
MHVFLKKSGAKVFQDIRKYSSSPPLVAPVYLPSQRPVGLPSSTVSYFSRFTVFHRITLCIALKGTVYVNRDQDSEPKERHNALLLSSAANETGVQLEAAEDDTQGVLIAGEPLDQPIFQYGPFGQFQCHVCKSERKIC